LAARGRGRDRRSLGAARSLSRVDACNPLLQAHPTWARDEHEGRGIPTSLTPVSGRLALPLHARPIWAGARGDIHSSAQGPPGLETPTKVISKTKKIILNGFVLAVFLRTSQYIYMISMVHGRLYI
jgi:hypothetical protein